MKKERDLEQILKEHSFIIALGIEYSPSINTFEIYYSDNYLKS